MKLSFRILAAKPINIHTDLWVSQVLVYEPTSCVNNRGEKISDDGTNGHKNFSGSPQRMKKEGKWIKTENLKGQVRGWYNRRLQKR